jgi:hypothetical protein
VASVLRAPANGLGHNFLVNSKSKRLGQSKRKGKKLGFNFIVYKRHDPRHTR